MSESTQKISNPPEPKKNGESVPESPTPSADEMLFVHEKISQITLDTNTHSVGDQLTQNVAKDVIELLLDTKLLDEHKPPTDTSAKFTTTNKPKSQFAASRNKTNSATPSPKGDNPPPPPLKSPVLPRINRKKLPKRAQKLSDEQILKAFMKRKSCNDKALMIIERLLESLEDQQELLDAVRDINDNHFQDVIDERAILKKCGYPLCHKPLEDIPKQKYHISLATNKVYDLTDRKNFCGAKCYKAAYYLKAQMLTSPLWLRDVEEIPNFKLLPIT